MRLKTSIFGVKSLINRVYNLKFAVWNSINEVKSLSCPAFYCCNNAVFYLNIGAFYSINEAFYSIDEQFCVIVEAFYFNPTAFSSTNHQLPITNYQVFRYNSRMSIYENFQPIDLEKIKTYELASRPSKVTTENFAAPVSENDSLKEFLDKLPDILAVQTLREVAKQIRRARELGKPIVLGIGGHIIKTGLAPVIIDLMNRGFVTAIASNGSVLVHDTEIALAGFTSEDVDASLGSGDFGAARETGEILNAAAKKGASDGIGLGEAMGREVLGQNPKNENVSLLCQSL